MLPIQSREAYEEPPITKMMIMLVAKVEQDNTGWWFQPTPLKNTTSSKCFKIIPTSPEYVGKNLSVQKIRHDLRWHT